jgi:AbrB family looped-hinge helix DNA binding protein
VEVLIDMSKVCLSSKYQVVIPKDVRQSLSLKAGVMFDVISADGRIELIPVREMSDMRGYLPGMNTDIDRDEEDRS